MAKKTKEKKETQTVTVNEMAKMKHFMVKEFTTEMLSGDKKHWCPDNEYGAIDDTMPEFEKCNCNLMGF